MSGETWNNLWSLLSRKTVITVIPSKTRFLRADYNYFRDRKKNREIREHFPAWRIRYRTKHCLISIIVWIVFLSYNEPVSLCSTSFSTVVSVLRVRLSGQDTQSLHTCLSYTCNPLEGDFPVCLIAFLAVELYFSSFFESRKGIAKETIVHCNISCWKSETEDSLEPKESISRETTKKEIITIMEEDEVFWQKFLLMYPSLFPFLIIILQLL